MPNGLADQLVIKKKRRRIAVDPCLGYYENNPTSSPTPYRSECSKEDVEQPEIHGDDMQKTGDSSDSVPPITSPLQSSDDHDEHEGFITVEGFLRQKAAASVGYNKKTYSRKARTIQSSPDVEEEDRTIEDDSGVGPPIPQTCSDGKRTVSKRKTKNSCRVLKKSSTKKCVPSSKRIQRAAMLASIEMDAPHTVPLQLVPRDQASPRTPPHDRRARLIDPRIPRRLDTSFANKENTPRDETKYFRPFLQWSCPCPQTTNPPYSSLLISRTPQRDRVTRDSRTPLDLVPYEEHDLSRSAKFDRKWSRKCPRMITPLFLEPQPQWSVPTDSQINVNDDPFMSLPLTAESHLGELSQVGAKGTSRIHTSNDTIHNFTPLSLETPALDILVPRSSQSPSRCPAYSPAQEVAKSTDDTATLNVQVKDSSENLGPVTCRTLTRSQSMHVPPPPSNRSQKPMRRIGTMLDGFRETARNLLLSQAQAGPGQPALTSDGPGATANAFPRRSSRRLVFSSPVRYSADEVTKAPTLSSAERDWNVSQECAQVPAIDRGGSARGSIIRIRKSLSMPSVSVSAFLGSDMFPKDGEGNSEDHCSEDMTKRVSVNILLGSTMQESRRNLCDSSSSRTPSRHRENPPYLPYEESRQRSDMHVNSATNLFDLQEHAASFHTNRPLLPPPTLFESRDGYAPPNLFDLLEGAEPYNGAQIVLSPCF